MLGTVKWFNPAKGFGFISPDDGSADLFVHHTAILDMPPGRRNLEQGQRVSFDSETSEKGRKAVNVRAVMG